ncbi:2-C-methyl-D-erythritol 4-phosphate cytidylyltransferase [Niallia nealsonii]|uniref:2-C-methyl-D-erythritol 4-phosphate cytidylyltransferase n=1 Tax=Niallia nealsonii TaxID=115979 RepID=A0A2N0Z4U7_9BACI|nr:2-C-methyl-D-erythritol 4-phosphate cytidylyltransferase [Niallia nealsonii]PKG24524.1 2-C-methyl-D-erythritol 4-phosphate cytidylyltransferase [Niallia nealsonii]
MTYEVIIPAAGQGKRMQAGKNKLFLTIDEAPIFIHTLKVFEQDSNCSRIWLVINPEEKQQMQEWIANFDIQKIAGLVAGGIERQYSIYNAIKLLGNSAIVLVHDAARPFINENQIKQLTEVAKENGAAVLAVPIKDTVKKVSGDIVDETVDRSSLWAIQTPQAFRISILKEAYEQAFKDSFLGTDDASLVERLGKEVKIVLGDYDNIKLTTPEDLYFAEAIIQKKKKVNEKE